MSLFLDDMSELSLFASFADMPCGLSNVTCAFCIHTIDAKIMFGILFRSEIVLRLVPSRKHDLRPLNQVTDIKHPKADK